MRSEIKSRVSILSLDYGMHLGVDEVRRRMVWIKQQQAGVETNRKGVKGSFRHGLHPRLKAGGDGGAGQIRLGALLEFVEHDEHRAEVRRVRVEQIRLPADGHRVLHASLPG